MRARILLVDDEHYVLQALKRVLSSHYEVYVASSGEEGLAVIDSRGPFAAIVSDVRMNGMTGFDFLREAAEADPTAQRLVLSGLPEEQVAEALVGLEIFRVHAKPVCTEEIAESLAAAVAKYRLDREAEDGGQGKQTAEEQSSAQSLPVGPKVT